MHEQRSPFDCFPLFGREPGIWGGLDGPTREKVLDCLALLLLQHLRQSACCAHEERTLGDDRSTY